MRIPKHSVLGRAGERETICRNSVQHLGIAKGEPRHSKSLGTVNTFFSKQAVKPPCMCLMEGNNTSPIGGDSRGQLFRDSSFQTQAQLCHVGPPQDRVGSHHASPADSSRGITEQAFPRRVANAPRSPSMGSSPARRCCWRWGIRRRYIGCSFVPAPGHQVNRSSHRSKNSQFAATRQNWFQSDVSSQTSLSKHRTVLSAIGLLARILQSS